MKSYNEDEYTKPSRFREHKKIKKEVRRDHPLHKPYERDTNWRNKLDEQLDDSYRSPSEEG